jgi:hypothetical protein
MEHIPEQQIDSIIKLFVTWNNHANEQVGRRMVHRFDKWFDCLATLHLGENKIKNQVHIKICQAFGTALTTITSPKELVPCAYQLFQTALEDHADTPKSFTDDVNNGMNAGEQIKAVWPSLSQTHQNLLLQMYTATKSNDTSFSSSEMVPLLQARYALKQAVFDKYLKGNENGIDWVLCSTMPMPDRDLIPMPLFESNRLKSAMEKQYFECWLINAPVICMDIQEFAPYAHALKEGCIVSEVKMTSQIQAEPLLQSNPESSVESTLLETDIPQQIEESDNMNSILKPIILLALTAAVLFGIYILVSSL